MITSGTVPLTNGVRGSGNMRSTRVLACAVALLALAGCGGNGNASTAQSSETDAAASMTNPMKQTTSPATSAPPAAAQVGQAVTNGGVTLTVTSAAAVPTIAMNQAMTDNTSPYAKFAAVPPPAGAKYVAVTVHVTNNSQVSMDLTCGYPIANKLVNAQQQQYDAIEDLYKLKGNPKCNNNLQPGFSSDMTYVYAVPATSQIVGWGFADATDVSVQHDYSAVAFSA